MQNILKAILHENVQNICPLLSKNTPYFSRGHVEHTTVWSVDVHQQTQRFVTSAEDHKVLLFAFNRTRPLRHLLAHTAGVDCVRFGHSGNLWVQMLFHYVCIVLYYRITSASSDDTIRQFDIRTAYCVRTLPGCNSCINFMQRSVGNCSCKNKLVRELERHTQVSTRIPLHIFIVVLFGWYSQHRIQ